MPGSAHESRATAAHYCTAVTDKNRIGEIYRTLKIPRTGDYRYLAITDQDESWSIMTFLKLPQFPHKAASAHPYVMQ